MIAKNTPYKNLSTGIIVTVIEVFTNCHGQNIVRYEKEKETPSEKTYRGEKTKSGNVVFNKPEYQFLRSYKPVI